MKEFNVLIVKENLIKMLLKDIFKYVRRKVLDKVLKDDDHLYFDLLLLITLF